jgi:nitrite reductase (NADH) small subunit
MTASRTPLWTRICPLDDLPVERGVTALVNGQAVAVFRTQDDAVYALANHDPFSRTSALARGIVGTRGGVPFVGSPEHKHSFDLRNGRCLEDGSVCVSTYDVRVEGGVVLVGPRRPSRRRSPRSPWRPPRRLRRGR